MNTATLDALKKISRTLREAGWTEPESPASVGTLTDDRIDELRRTSARLVPAADFHLLQEVVIDGTPVAEVARSRGLSSEQVREGIGRALHALGSFAEEAIPMHS
jgi:hypothetical protein